MSKLHALEEETKPNTFSWKLIALGVLLIAGALTTYVFGNRKTTVKKETGTVLGTGTNALSMQKKIEDVSKPYLSYVENGAQSLLHSVSQNVVSLAAESANKAKQYVFDSSLSTFINQIHTLPQPIQEEIKKQICK